MLLKCHLDDNRTALSKIILFIVKFEIVVNVAINFFQLGVFNYNNTSKLKIYYNFFTFITCVLLYKICQIMCAQISVMSAYALFCIKFHPGNLFRSSPDVIRRRMDTRRTCRSLLEWIKAGNATEHEIFAVACAQVLVS